MSIWPAQKASHLLPMGLIREVTVQAIMVRLPVLKCVASHG